jgi:hypothetical protein
MMIPDLDFPKVMATAAAQNVSHLLAALACVLQPNHIVGSFK